MILRPLRILPIVFLAFLFGAVGYVKAHRAAQQQPIGGVLNERTATSIALLAAIGNEQPTPAIVAEVVIWSIAEDGGGGALRRNNPWNTTMCGFNMIGSINVDGACGVGHYATMEDGIAANAATLAQGNFSAVRAALLANDPQAFRHALWASPWAASHYGWGASWPVEETRALGLPPPVSLPNNLARATGPAYLLQGDVGVNVRAALDANEGALQRFEIQPGHTWSFGRSIAPISALGSLPVVCGPAGCYAGGGWCDLSALYVKVADELGLHSDFPAHAGVANTRFPGILLDEWGGGGDLTITNTNNTAVAFRVFMEGDTLIIEGGFTQ
jgi:hypothetical protein